MDNAGFLILAAIGFVMFWGVLGAAVTANIASNKGRSEAAGCLTGLLLGITGGFFLLIPLWVYMNRKLPDPDKWCPACKKPIPLQAKECPYCGQSLESMDVLSAESSNVRQRFLQERAATQNRPAEYPH
jgi:hypothetical protein